MRDQKRNAVTRRQFVRDGLATAAAVAAAPVVFSRSAGKDAATSRDTDLGTIPRVDLGKTGEKVPILGLGTACLGHKNRNKPELGELVEVFSEAIDRGVTYVDTARIYGRAEEALGTVLKTRRDKVFLVTKVMANTAMEARKSVDESLRRLGTDSVDLLHLHSTGSRDIDVVLGPEGAWGEFLKLRKAGRTRFLGLSGHNRPANFTRLIRESDRTIDVLMLAMNFVDYHTYGFEEKVLPLAREQGIGIMAMKVFGGIKGSFPKYSLKVPNPSQMDSKYHDASVRYARSLEGVTGMVIGVHTAAQLRDNIRRVIGARPLPDGEIAALRARGKALSATWGPRFGPAA